MRMQSIIVKRCRLMTFIFLAGGIATSLIAAQAPVNGTSAQAPPPVNAQPPMCAPDKIDTTYVFRDHPAGEQTVSLYFLNKDNAACRLKDAPNPSFSVDGHYLPRESCPFCGTDGKPAPMWSRRPENQIVLAPGATAAIDMNWASTGGSCQYADWVDIFFNWIDSPVYNANKLTNFLFIPSGWPMRICSSIRSFGYRIATDSPAAERKSSPALHVSLRQKMVYSDERATVHVELVWPAQSGDKSAGCATLYSVRKPAPSQTRLDPVRVAGSTQVDSYTPEQIREDKERPWPQWKRDFKRACPIAGGATSADAEIAAGDLATVTRLEWRTAPALGTEPTLLSIATHFDVLDVDSLTPNWGEPVKGIRAGLSVDNERFTAGDRIPLHIRWENVDASDPLGQGECWEPEPKLEIQDSQHHVLKTLPMESMCMGHGWGPFEIAKGKQQHVFRELTTVSELPGPGTYFLVTVWSARILEKTENDAPIRGRIGAGKIGAVYATAQSTPVRIEIVP